MAKCLTTGGVKAGSKTSYFKRTVSTLFNTISKATFIRQKLQIYNILKRPTSVIEIWEPTFYIGTVSGNIMPSLNLNSILTRLHKRLELSVSVRTSDGHRTLV